MMYDILWCITHIKDWDRRLHCGVLTALREPTEHQVKSCSDTVSDSHNVSWRSALRGLRVAFRRMSFNLINGGN